MWSPAPPPAPAASDGAGRADSCTVQVVETIGAMVHGAVAVVRSTAVMTPVTEPRVRTIAVSVVVASVTASTGFGYPAFFKGCCPSSELPSRNRVEAVRATENAATMREVDKAQGATSTVFVCWSAASDGLTKIGGRPKDTHRGTAAAARRGYVRRFEGSALGARRGLETEWFRSSTGISLFSPYMLEIDSTKSTHSTIKMPRLPSAGSAARAQRAERRGSCCGCGCVIARVVMVG